MGNDPFDGLGDGLGPALLVLGLLVLGLLVLGLLVLGLLVLGLLVLGLLLEGVALGVPRVEAVGVIEPVPPGENEGGVVDGELPVQADTDAGASMAKAA